ncbi:annexin A1-like [Genypterus blacodes]|uniref:annexin A1-like n=1 Tax=Genypterus blacodes TaxID=154954 RepID=UPI003F75C62C
MSAFKTFFKNIIKAGDPDDDTVTVKGKKKQKYHGTVSPYPNFKASEDASVLQSAIESKGVDEDVIISVLVRRTNEQRQKIKTVYEVANGKRLDLALESIMRRDLEDVTLALLMPPAQFDAHQLRKATKGWGTTEDVLTEILATRTNEEIREIKKVFKQEYGEDLGDIIEADTKGDFNLALQALLRAERDEGDEVNMDMVHKDAKTLFEACDSTEGLDVAAFIEILTTRNGKQLSKTFQKYASMSDLTLPKVLDRELKGDIEDCLIDIVKCAWNKPAYFAEKLHKAMERHGTCDKTLIRILVSRSEEDLKKIVEQYRTMYGVRLQEAILEETKGHYEQVLIGLCGPH